ncbi:hypothetical protein Tco_0978343 [Tanacetum coccineum]|uniref:Retrotransposon gag domain-containing protein n=1 Tax=Tanacetum coccineum TaxID=301880 RepID=A0ABQ5EMN8_9ASTR
MVATFEEHEQQENQYNLNEFSEEKDDAKPLIFIDTVGNNGGNDSRTLGSETPAKEVVDNGIESEVVVGLPEEFQEGDMVDALSIVEQKSLGNWKELDNESEDRKVERDAKREGEPTILATFGSDRASTRLKWCPIPIQPRTWSYQLVLSLRALIERAFDPEGNDPDAEYALYRPLQRGTVAEYHNEFGMLISRVTGKSDSLLASIYIFGLKPTLQRALLWSNTTTLGEAFSLARVAEARFANQGPTTTCATPNLKPPTSPILTIGGSQNKACDSPTTPEVAPEIPSEALRETTTTADTVAKIKETGEFYTLELEEYVTKPKKGKSDDDGFKWGVQEVSIFEELKQQISTTSILSLPDFNEVFVGPRMSLAATYQKEVVTEWPEEFQEGPSLEKSMAICDSRVVFLKTAMQRRLWDPRIKSAFQDDTLRARWFLRSEECYALSLG